ncbi:YgaP family membrane protein [Viridibacillus arvi]|uniref:YgaP family membrane protein n=1 Tax=Viridibacillus arvi TaxID=263475 RepID=UPI0036EAE829
MTQSENLSTKNAFMRLTCGITMTAFGIGRISRDSNCTGGRLMIIIGAMKTAEGILKYCPTKAMMNSTMKSVMDSSMTSAFGGQAASIIPNIDQLMKDFAGGNSNANSNNNSNSNTNSNSNSNSNNNGEKNNSQNSNTKNQSNDQNKNTNNSQSNSTNS